MFNGSPSPAETLLLAGYIVFSMGLNSISYLISSFYKRKFGRPSPGLPFILSLFLSAFFLIALLSGKLSEPVTQAFALSSLLGSALISMGGIVSLFFTMLRIRK